MRSSQGRLCPAASEPEAVEDSSRSLLGPSAPSHCSPWCVSEEQARSGGLTRGGSGAEGGRPGELGQLGRAGTLCPSIGLGPGSACRLRWPYRGGAERCRVRPAVRPRGSLGLAHPQPLPPAPPPGSPLLPRPACDLTWEPLSLDLLRCLGLGFPTWLWGCLRPGHVLLLKWGSCRGRLFPCRAGGPSDLGELLFRRRMVKDSPRASCLWDPHPPHSALCLQEGQCRPWVVPVSAAASSRACRDEAGRSLAHLAPGPRPGRPAGAVQRGSAEVRSFLAPQEGGCH